jgi:hypothetical protein
MNDISVLLGKTIEKITGGQGDSELYFSMIDGPDYRMLHDQDCCESVYLDDIAGDLEDLCGSPVLQAEESSNSEEREQGDSKATDDSFTWTFYRIATAKGLVVLRWLGESNGYYGESVDFRPA